MYRSAVSSLSADYWRGRRVLVTGASGFLGTWLCQLLMAEGATVHGQGRRNRPAHTHHPLQASLPEEAAALVASVAPDTIFHLASPIYFGEDAQDLARLGQGIVDATEALLAAATGRNIRFVHAGTCAEYGRAPAPHREDGPTIPINTYGTLKTEATSRVLAAPFDVTVVRPFRAIGPGDSTSVVAGAARAALRRRPFEMTEGRQIREWNHAATIAQGIMMAGSHPAAIGQVLNLGGGESRSVYGVVKAVFEAAGADVNLIQRGARPSRPNEPALLSGDHSKTCGLWGSLAQPSLDQTLAEAVQWTRTHLGCVA
jgi:UDP-glucose 4-epimerase